MTEAAAMSELARQLVEWHAEQAGILEDDGEDFDPEPPPRSHWDATKLTAEVQAIINRIEEEGLSANQLRMLGYLHPALKAVISATGSAHPSPDESRLPGMMDSSVSRA
jgi:hypothetical protein